MRVKRLMPVSCLMMRAEIRGYANDACDVDAYPFVYYVSIAFGVLSIICSVFLGDIKKYMTVWHFPLSVESWEISLTVSSHRTTSHNEHHEELRE